MAWSDKDDTHSSFWVSLFLFRSKTNTFFIFKSIDEKDVNVIETPFMNEEGSQFGLFPSFNASSQGDKGIQV
jgi:hypothetical protein